MSGEKEKKDNYITLLSGVIEPLPTIDGGTSNPAVMRQHHNHTPHTLTGIMYIIIAETSDKNCLDDIRRQKSEEPTEAYRNKNDYFYRGIPA